MTKMRFFDFKEEQEFDSPPLFNSDERKRFLKYHEEIRDYAETMKSPTKKVCFLLAASYFKVTQKFYPNIFHKKDVSFLCDRLQINIRDIDVSSYDRQTYSLHKRVLLDLLGCTAFDQNAADQLVEEMTPMILSHVKPREILFSMIEYLRRHHIEIPSYHALSLIITTGLLKHKKSLTVVIRQHLSKETRRLLDTLMEKVINEETGQSMNRYRLTWLKKSSQSLRPGEIHGNIEELKILHDLYCRIESIIEVLRLPLDGIKYFANSVIKFNYLQVEQKSDEDRYLHLITFIVHQYFRLQDTLIDIFLQSHQNVINSALREEKERVFKDWENRKKSMAKVVDHLSSDTQAFEKIESIILDASMPSLKKLDLVRHLVQEEKERRQKLTIDIVDMTRAQHETKESIFYEVLKSKSKTLQNRLSEIVKYALFNEAASDGDLIDAINNYKEKDGKLNGKNIPLKCFYPQERKMMYDAEGNFDISLYKALLFSKMSNAIKSGALNLTHSYKYRTLDDYLIAKDAWVSNRENYLRRAELTHLSDPKVILSDAKKQVDQAYCETNQHFLSGENTFLRIDEKDNIRVKTPKLESESTEEPTSIGDYMPVSKSIPIAEVLSAVNRLTGFLDSFEHWQGSHVKKQKPEKLFYAAIIGHGCNIGLPEMANISPSISEGALAYLVNWNFSVNNLLSANDRILSFINKLALPKIYKIDENKTVTSSDGQKFDMDGDSLNANYSFKYFGQKKGVSVYSFIDERHLLFYSTVINAAEREVAYVLDGLLHNDVVQSDMHSTDTHGYSEMLFAVTQLLGFEYAPRIKNLKDQQLYSFHKKKEYEDKGYKIFSGKYIREDRIRKHWDEILRFVATIKLKVTTASQLFKRLNSYSKQNPLMEALKEYGKIEKTISILKYVDDVTRRQQIEKQLNKIESSHRLKHALTFNGGEFTQATKEEQDIAEGCRRLIANAIVCWNYAHLSQMISEEQSEAKQKAMIKTIKNGSILIWRHINFFGEYDFSDEKIKDSVGLNLAKILELKLP